MLIRKFFHLPRHAVTRYDARSIHGPVLWRLNLGTGSECGRDLLIHGIVWILRITGSGQVHEDPFVCLLLLMKFMVGVRVWTVRISPPIDEGQSLINNKQCYRHYPTNIPLLQNYTRSLAIQLICGA